MPTLISLVPTALHTRLTRDSRAHIERAGSLVSGYIPLASLSSWPRNGGIGGMHLELHMDATAKTLNTTVIFVGSIGGELKRAVPLSRMPSPVLSV